MAVPNAPRRRRNAEIYARYKAGETQVSLAAAYNLSKQSIWVICKEGAAHDIPPIEDRAAWRNILAAAYAERLATAHENDTASFVALAKGLRDLGGLDFRHELEARLVRIEAQKLELLRDAVKHAMVAAELDQAQRLMFGEALDNRLAELEAAG